MLGFCVFFWQKCLKFDLKATCAPRNTPSSWRFPPVQTSVLTAQLFRGALLTISNSRAMADVPQIAFTESSHIPLCDRSLTNSSSHVLNQMGIKTRTSCRPNTSLSAPPHPAHALLSKATGMMPTLTLQTTHTQTKGIQSMFVVRKLF